LKELASLATRPLDIYRGFLADVFLISLNDWRINSLSRREMIKRFERKAFNRVFKFADVKRILNIEVLLKRLGQYFALSGFSFEIKWDKWSYKY
jgi:hypothetical protein